MKSKGTDTMHKAYRVCFFEANVAHAVAVLVLHFPSDAAAQEEALQLLSASALTRVELWQGTRKVYQSRPGVSRQRLASCSFHV
jgi:hypothetical protein